MMAAVPLLMLMLMLVLVLVLVPPSSSLASRPKPARLWSLQPRTA